ncbi:MAG: hypothetical protein VR73_03370 [Gammaproteobacteria bacterium BRH_c0]|nr:MAG: hypothetical protein VR73_03370 [Gammaproteobacteria bacterium BRH_c0]
MTVLGALPNAPLACVLVALEYEEIPDFAKKVEQLKGRILSLLPRYRLASLQQIQAAGHSHHLPIHEFLGEDWRQLLRVSPHQAAFVVTAYANAEEFLGQFEQLLGPVWETLEPLITRIGVRYIDFILPRPGEAPEDYVNDSIRGIANLPMGQIETQSAHLTQYQFDDGAMSIRYATTDGQPQLPAEIALGNLRPSDIMLNEQNGKCAILDFDRFQFVSERLSHQDVVQRVRHFQGQLSQIFKHITTDKARQAWGREE